MSDTTEAPETTVSVTMSATDAETLRDLAKKLVADEPVATSLAQAQPVYYGIVDTRRIPVPRESDYTHITIVDDGEGFSPEDWLKNQLEQDRLEPLDISADVFSVTVTSSNNPDGAQWNVDIKQVGNDEYVADMFEAPDGITRIRRDEDDDDDTAFDDVSSIPEIVYERDEEYIREDVMFLTKAEAEQHLQNNSYHYGADAHVFAMTAWRAPDTELLLKTIKDVFGRDDSDDASDASDTD